VTSSESTLAITIYNYEHIIGGNVADAEQYLGYKGKIQKSIMGHTQEVLLFSQKAITEALNEQPDKVIIEGERKVNGRTKNPTLEIET
jgi:hypothetical protein